jgi:prepilin-type N-terminal cleavage/methylation domain-containing protein
MFKAMQQRIRTARHEESGFTLIELLIVIVILGVLAGIVVFAVSGVQNDSKTAACKADVKSVTVAEEAYYAKNGSYAATTTDLNNSGLLHSAPTDVKITVTTGDPAATPPTVDKVTVTGAGGDCPTSVVG